MKLISPSVLQAGQGLSITACAIAIAVGLLLWFTGWRFYRFWLVLGVTVAGGIYGLSQGDKVGMPTIITGLLIAIGAGVLGVELSRIFAFLASGFLLWLGATQLFPHAQELGFVFLIGGLIGIFMYHLWVMTLTSFLGTLISWHGTLLLLDQTQTLKAVPLAQNQSLTLSIAVLVVTILGVFVQITLWRWDRRRQTRKKTKQAEQARKLLEREKYLRERERFDARPEETYRDLPPPH
jgi:hypothetical protein